MLCCSRRLVGDATCACYNPRVTRAAASGYSNNLLASILVLGTSSRMEDASLKRPQVVIVGAGFGGLEAAKNLACEDVSVTVIDRTNYHLFQPLLYQVATAALSPANIEAPIRAIFSTCENMEVILAEVQSVDVDAKKVKTADGIELTYD